MFDWNTVITNMAALSISGVTVMDHAPQFTQDCRVPALYPSYSPSVTLNSVERGSACETDPYRVLRYTLNYVYLHIETTQDTDNSQYEIAIRAAMASIFAAVAANDTALGVYLVTPTGFSIAEKLIEVGGRTYLGGQVTLEAQEWQN
jgi:hypothetical protein